MSIVDVKNKLFALNVLTYQESFLLAEHLLNLRLSYSDMCSVLNALNTRGMVGVQSLTCPEIRGFLDYSLAKVVNNRPSVSVVSIDPITMISVKSLSSPRFDIAFFVSVLCGVYIKEFALNTKYVVSSYYEITDRCKPPLSSYLNAEMDHLISEPYTPTFLKSYFGGIVEYKAPNVFNFLLSILQKFSLTNSYIPVFISNKEYLDDYILENISSAVILSSSFEDFEVSANSKIKRNEDLARVETPISYDTVYTSTIFTEGVDYDKHMLTQFGKTYSTVSLLDTILLYVIEVASNVVASTLVSDGFSTVHSNFVDLVKTNKLRDYIL